MGRKRMHYTMKFWEGFVTQGIIFEFSHDSGNFFKDGNWLAWFSWTMASKERRLCFQMWAIGTQSASRWKTLAFNFFFFSEWSPFNSPGAVSSAEPHTVSIGWCCKKKRIDLLIMPPHTLWWSLLVFFLLRFVNFVCSYLWWLRAFSNWFELPLTMLYSSKFVWSQFRKTSSECVVKM